MPNFTNETTINKSKSTDIRRIAMIGMLSALAFIIMYFEVPLPFLPSFYKIDFSEVPVLIGGFAMGPVAAAIIEAVKVILHLVIKGTPTAGIGDFANFIIGCGFVVPASMIYKCHKSRKNAVVGMTVGVLVMAVVGGLLNAFLLLPAYAAAFHMPMEAIVGMGTSVNHAIVDVPTLVLFATTPLNLIKGILASILTLLLYKRVSPLIHGRV
ncbi:MAG: ECF transporter S component [Clostridiales bacterium]|jgi:riboflavin transporter FmnP|nr:ECF transporter S component [Clostridiales bacterium]MCI2161259.1 ECF transporter S component [Oscillospiraceae bacterium]MCI1961923.1 ECF transporter S component [Clostridiales bacterium]MCI2022344.1 ECF transporter S component [Clostridiales bacterium]MCI2026741.1 ECF transporter S component [Clostridiales bacterium]